MHDIYPRECCNHHVDVMKVWPCPCECHTPQQENTIFESVVGTQKDVKSFEKEWKHPKTEQEKDWLDEHHEKKVNELIGKPTDASWEEQLQLGGEIIDFEGDLRRDGIDKLKELIRKVREEAKITAQLEHSDRFIQQGIEIGRRRAVGEFTITPETLSWWAKTASKVIKEVTLAHPNYPVLSEHQLLSFVKRFLPHIRSVLEAASREI